MKKVVQIDLKKAGEVGRLFQEYNKAGVLGAGDLGRGIDIIEEMFRGSATVFLGIAGPLVASGMRTIVTDLIRDGLLDGVVTNGANIVHDLIEGFGGSHYRGQFDVDDSQLREAGLGRIGNVLTKIDEDLRGNISVMELTGELGRTVKDKKSFLRAAYEKGVPVFSPGITDSMLGLQMWMFSQDNTLVLNVLKDMS
jgi:deoxyhypusine synthase